MWGNLPKKCWENCKGSGSKVLCDRIFVEELFITYVLIWYERIFVKEFFITYTWWAPSEFTHLTSLDRSFTGLCVCLFFFETEQSRRPGFSCKASWDQMIECFFWWFFCVLSFDVVLTRNVYVFFSTSQLLMDKTLQQLTLVIYQFFNGVLYPCRWFDSVSSISNVFSSDSIRCLLLRKLLECT